MKILDLFCCCGGAAMGLSDNGKNEVTGVDITDNHVYPFEFINKDVFDLDINYIKKFDLIWASPPCQYYIPTNKWRGNNYPDLIGRTRELLLKTGKPFIIENVQGAPVRKDLKLCGEMFGLRVIRHRFFEIEGFTVLQPPHQKHKRSVMNGTAVSVCTGGVHPGFWGNKEKQREFTKHRKSYYACVAGHGGHGFSRKISVWQQAMGIHHIKKEKHLTQAIPPAYSSYILQYFSTTPTPLQLLV